MHRLRIGDVKIAKKTYTLQLFYTKLQRIQDNIDKYIDSNNHYLKDLGAPQACPSICLVSNSCLKVLRVFTKITSFPLYFRTSIQHYYDLETSLKNLNRGLWCKLNIATPPP